MEQIGAIILAAGQGTRMRSQTNKVLHPLLGRPLVSYSLQAAAECCQRLVLVSGHQREQVNAAAASALSDTTRLVTVTQHEQLGTGHAVMQAESASADLTWAVILCADVPLLRSETLSQLIEAAKAHGTMALLGFTTDEPGGYGRLLRDESGHVRQIVEARDCTPAQRAITTVNAGIYCVRRDHLFQALRQLTTNNAQGEYYLTDVVATVAGGAATLDVAGEEVQGVNTRWDLAAVRRVLQQRIHQRLALESGVTILDPASTTIEPGVRIGQDTVIGCGVSLRGNTTIGQRCSIDDGSILSEMTLGDDVTVKPHSVLSGSIIGDGCSVGPFMHMREGTQVGRNAKLGNFVETKKAVLADGVKAGHLSYLGDCELGEAVNVGAGTITCNYDGVSKHKTTIGANVFIGSNTELVAPVTLGDEVYVGAGTTVTRDVPAGALVVSRVPQKTIEGYVARKRAERSQQ